MFILPLVKKILATHVDSITGIPEIILIGWSQNNLVEEHLARYMLASRLAYGSVLDVACGTGYGSSILLRDKKVDYIVSVDIDITLLKYGKKVFKLETVEADALNLPFRDNSFDTVVSIETIEHLPSPKWFIKEVARVLRRSGIFILSTPNKLYSSPLVKKPINPYHVKEFYLGEILYMLESEGFKPIFILCGKPHIKLVLFRRIVGTLVKSTFKIIGLKPYVLDDIFHRLRTILNIEDRNEFKDPNPRKIRHHIARINTNFQFCEYFVIVSII